jgi:hypothetical protein
MTKPALKRLISINAGIWGLATLASVILPFVADSLSSGEGKFLRLVMQAGPLLAGLWISSAFLGKALDDSARTTGLPD